MKCPQCSSAETTWKSKAAEWECNSCEERFEGEPPAGNPESVRPLLPAKAAKPKRIFFSYGHDANRELVDRFKADLEARGHQVWIDYKEIGSWDDWKGTITRGIHDAEMAIAFLSIHSMLMSVVRFSSRGISQSFSQRRHRFVNFKHKRKALEWYQSQL